MRKQLPFTRLLVSFTVLTTLSSTAQDFAPVNAYSRKLFATLPGYHATFGIAFDSTTVDGGITTHHNYKTVWDTLTTTGCAFWVTGDQCYKQDRPTWAGARIEADGQGVHTMYNLWEEPITFAFSTTPGSQTVMYADADEQFLLSYTGEVSQDVLGLTENVRQWTILHQDLGGQPINSALNNALVEVAENVGLLSYFRVDSFPLVLQPVELVGQSSPQLGLHTITPAFLNDFQPGDVIQTHYFANYYMGPPWLDYNSYSTVNVLSRTDSPTEVTYEVQTVSFSVDSMTEVTNTSTVSYSKGDILATIPFDRFDGTLPSLGMEDYCGLSLWTYRTYLNTGLGYCPEENCWGGYDTNGPPPVGGSTLVGGLGNYASSESIINPEGYYVATDIVYFEKNGVECMQEVIMGVGDAGALARTVVIAPNPADAQFTWRSVEPLSRLDVIDPQGRSVASIPVRGTSGTIDTSAWPTGLYMVRSIGVGGVRSMERILISR